MKKLILFLLLIVTTFGLAQPPTQPTAFPNGVKITGGNPTVTSVNFLTTTETDGVQKKIAPINVPIPYTPVNYSISGQTIGQHITGIDTRLGQISSTSAGITQRVYFTADNTTVNSVVYFASSLTGKGSTATGSPPALVLGDNTKGYFTKDIISIAQPSATIGYAGTYSGNLTVSASPTPNATQQRFTVEIYRTNNLGAPISSGVSGAPTGDLGVTVVAILDSGVINLTAGSITNVPVSGILTQNITLNTGERLRYHVSAAKIGTGGGNVTFGVYYGTSYNSYYDVPVAVTTDAVVNKSSVTGVTATDALNTLQTTKADVLAAFTAGRVPYTTGTTSLTDSNRFLWNNTTSDLEINGTNPKFRIKNNLNNYSSYFNMNSNGDLMLKNHQDKTIAVFTNPVGSNSQAQMSIGNFPAPPLEAQLFVYGGENGANIDARGSAELDESNIDLEGNDWNTSASSLGFSYFGSLRTGISPLYGYAKTNLGQIRFSNSSTALITSRNADLSVTPIRFGINESEVANVNDRGLSYQSNFASVNSANPRWLTDKGYVDSLVVGLLDDRGSYNASTNLFPTTGGSGASGTVLKGDLWYVSVAGTLGGKAVAVGDSFRALSDSPGQTASNWAILSSNLSYVPANDANVIHTSGAETKTGQLIVSHSLNSQALGGQNTGSGIGVAGYSNTGFALFANATNGIGLRINHSTGNTSRLMSLGVNNGEVLSSDYLGNLTANSFVKTGASASDILLGNGTTIGNGSFLHTTGNENFSGTKTGNTGTGKQVDLLGSSSALYAITFSTNATPAILGSSSNSQPAIVAFSGVGGSGNNFEGRNQGATTFTVNKTGDVYASGNVGIGTATTPAKLSIAGNLGTGGSTIRVTNTDTNDYIGFSAGVAGFSNSGAGISVNGINRMFVSDAGNVGINTFPFGDSKFQVKALPNVNLAFRYGDADATAAQISAYNDAASANIPIEFKATKYNFTVGNVLINTNIDNGVDKLQVNGTVSSAGLTTQALSADADATFNAMPDSSMSTTTSNEIISASPDGFYYLESFRYSSISYGMQRATYFTGTDKGKVYVRVKDNGTWTGWVEK